MPELVLELGCEELPASAVFRAFTELHRLIGEGLSEAGIPFSAGEPPMGTPRRLIVHFADVAAEQPDQTKEVRGPGVGAAFGADGAPSKALEGFCRGQGVDVSQIEQRDGYVWAVRVDKGRPTIEVLAEVIPKAIKGLTFDKTMRWGSGRMRFARPIRWIVALLGGQVVPFDIEGVASGSMSRGHRFYAPEAFEVTSYNQLMTELLKRKVEPNPEERRKTIFEIAMVTASGAPQISKALLDENVFLTEWPTPIEGSFPAEYLELPEPVLVTAMAKHEKMFPVRDASGNLLNKFIFVRNGGEDDAVREGTAWVLRARFNDAKFFFDEDKKKDLLEFHADTERLVFQEKLGSVRKRADRLEHLATVISESIAGHPSEFDDACVAAKYSKADLCSGLVSELPSLQGVVGGIYAKRSNFNDRVCYAITNHYSPNAIKDLSIPENRVAFSVMLADQIDKITGYLGIGLSPSGSSDPFGLRRAASITVESLWPGNSFDIAELVQLCCTDYIHQGVEIDTGVLFESLEHLLRQRYEALSTDTRYDILDAALSGPGVWPGYVPSRVRSRVESLKLLCQNKSLVQTCTRPLNILRNALDKGIEIPEMTDELSKDLASEASVLLWNTIKTASPPVLSDDVKAMGPTLSEALEDLVVSMEGPIHEFFEATMIMSPDPTEQKARLALVQATANVLLSVGDFTKIVLEGE